MGEGDYYTTLIGSETNISLQRMDDIFRNDLQYFEAALEYYTGSKWAPKYKKISLASMDLICNAILPHTGLQYQQMLYGVFSFR